jgi:NAD(P)-dependent dehydrogenase (short-subunit alcohol dehydrogenase family)
MQPKVALVTGGVTGIGRAVVEALAREGAVVSICDIDAGRGPQVERELQSAGARVRLTPLLRRKWPPR